MRLPAGAMIFMAALLLAMRLGSETPCDPESEGLAESLERWTGAAVAFDPRRDVYRLEHPGPERVRVAGVDWGENPGLASRATMAIREQESRVEAEVVLTSDQVNPAIDAAISGDWDLMGLVQLYLWDTPRLYRLACRGRGRPETLAKILGKLFRQPGCPEKPPARIIAREDLTAEMNRLGMTGRPLAKGFWITDPPGDDGRQTGYPGAGTWAMIWGSRGAAVMDTAWALAPGRVTPVVSVLRRGGVWITAIYPRPEPEPATIIVRAWGRGPLKKLVRTLQRARQEKSLEASALAW